MSADGEGTAGIRVGKRPPLIVQSLYRAARNAGKNVERGGGGWRKEGHADEAVVSEMGGELCIVAYHIGSGGGISTCVLEVRERE